MDKTAVKPEAATLSALAAAYKVDPRTLKRWIKPHEAKIGTPPGGRIFTPCQVAAIYEALGEP